MHMQSNNDEKNIDSLTHLQEKLPLMYERDICKNPKEGQHGIKTTKDKKKFVGRLLL